MDDAADIAALEAELRESPRMKALQLAHAGILSAPTSLALIAFFLGGERRLQDDLVLALLAVAPAPLLVLLAVVGELTYRRLLAPRRLGDAALGRDPAPRIGPSSETPAERVLHVLRGAHIARTAFLEVGALLAAVALFSGGGLQGLADEPLLWLSLGTLGAFLGLAALTWPTPAHAAAVVAVGLAAARER